MSAILAAKSRLRPILMTSLTTVLGALPMIFAVGPSAIGNHSISAATIGGMLSGIIGGLIFTPPLFVGVSVRSKKNYSANNFISNEKSNNIYNSAVGGPHHALPPHCKRVSGLDSPLEFNAVDILETSADSLLGWEDFFADPNLEPYIRKALDNNFDIREAIDQSRIIEEYLKTARVAWLPDLTLAAGGNYRRYTDSEKFQYGSRTQTGYSIPLQLSWEVDIWGRLRKEKQAAASDYLQSAEAVHAVKSNVIAQTAALYYTFQLQKEQEAIMGNLLSLGDSIVSMETKRFEWVTPAR